MQRVFLITFACVLTVVAALLVVRGNQPELYKLTNFVSAKQDVVDFGECLEHDVLSAEFTLTNCYSSEITNITATGGCACQKTEVSQARVAAGQPFTVRTKWNTSGKRNQVRDNIIVTYKSGDTIYSRELFLTALVRPELEVEGTLTFDAALSRSEVFSLKHRDALRVTIDAAHANTNFLTTTIDRANQSVQVQFQADKFVPNAGSGPIVIHVTLSGTKTRELAVPVKVSGESVPGTMPGPQH